MGQGRRIGQADRTILTDYLTLNVTGDALILSRQTGKPEAIELMEKPSIY